MARDVPDDILFWPSDLRHQWLADELWHDATGEQDPAPAGFVAAFVQLARLVAPLVGGM